MTPPVGMSSLFQAWTVKGRRPYRVALSLSRCVCVCVIHEPSSGSRCVSISELPTIQKVPYCCYCKIISVSPCLCLAHASTTPRLATLPRRNPEACDVRSMEYAIETPKKEIISSRPRVGDSTSEKMYPLMTIKRKEKKGVRN